jgi:serine/threonine protein phosphatase PrpC
MSSKGAQYFFESSARSVLGLVREGNEDSGFTSAKLIAVADGMGGHAGGEVASRIAIKTLASLTSVLSNPEIDSDSIEDLLQNSLHTIDNEIGEHAREAIEVRGMGTTLTALLLYGAKIALLHVGDSRAYRLRGNDLEQLSCDHTVMQELLDQGAISPADIREHPQRSVLTQALMGDGNVTPVLQIYDVKENDRFVLCSDGLSSVLSDKEMKALLKKKTADESITALIEATYINGAPDNISIIIADIVTSSEVAPLFIGAAQ